MTHRIQVADLFADVVFERYPTWREWWVDIRPHRGHAAQQRLTAARSPSLAMKAGEFDKMVAAREGADAEAAVEAAAEATIEVPFGGSGAVYTAVLVETAVVDWNLTDDAGTKLPVGRSGAEHPDLHPDLMDQIVDAIEDFYQEQRIPEALLKRSATA